MANIYTQKLENMRATTFDGRALTYHRTVVARLSDDGQRATLDSGGWRTPTTKNRINWALHQWGFSAQVYQKAGEWYVTTVDGPIPFQDGMTVHRA